MKDVAADEGVGLGSATDTDLLAGGAYACEIFDADGSWALGASMLVADLPDDVDADGFYLVALIAAAELCPEHWERIGDEARA